MTSYLHSFKSIYQLKKRTTKVKIFAVLFKEANIFLLMFQ
jgi:hypothetical protein